MRRAAITALGILLALPATLEAHQLDEYLQATRLAVAPGRIAIELDLTPGVRIASEIVRLIDRNGDGVVTAPEARAYGDAVLAEIVLVLDGGKLPLTLQRVEVPSAPEMKEGVGIVRIRAFADVAGLTTGRHRIHYRNDHRPTAAVYLANALMPDTPAVSIASQRRDERQRELHLEYDLTQRAHPFAWSAAAVALLGVLAISRRRVST